jgi:rhamnulokinase
MAPRTFAAIDLGASSGRVVTGTLEGERVSLEVVHRFPNRMHEVDGHLGWDLSGLFDQVLVGLGRAVERHPDLESIGIDTWGVDYGLLDEDGRLIAQPISYRDGRTAAVIDDVHRCITPDALFRINGLQLLPFNTIYQLAAEQRGPLWARAAHVLLLPDLIAHWLTGRLATEYTNATTTGLVDARNRDWSEPLLDALGLSSDLLPPIEQPGTVRGPVRDDLRERLALAPSAVVTSVGSHDTASAVAAVPATAPGFAYVSSGTWSLVGVEIDEPTLTDDARQGNFTNEGGVDGRIRFLRNVGGFWLLEESLRTWAERGEVYDVDDLVAEAAAMSDVGARINVDDPRFVAPGDMPARIADAVGSSGGPVPAKPAELVRCVVESLADTYARTAHDAARLSGSELEVVHIVGGGARNALLGQATADAAGVRVIAGPVEATAIGNVLVQARAHGAITGSLEHLRDVVVRSAELRQFEPELQRGDAPVT